jgi:hypothetical protein
MVDDTPTSSTLPRDGVPFDEALKYTPAWPEYIAAPYVPLHRQLAGFPRTEEENRAVEARTATHRKCRQQRNEKLEDGIWVLQCRDPAKLDGPRETIPRTMIRSVTVDGRGQVHLPGGRVLGDPWILPVESVKAVVKQPTPVDVVGLTAGLDKIVAAMTTGPVDEGISAYDLIRKLAVAEFGNALRYTELGKIIHRVGEKIQKMGLPVPTRHQFAHALKGRYSKRAQRRSKNK